MKIGIPRALLYYYYYPFWKSLFGTLGIEVFVSSPTSELSLNKGIKNSLSEICVPMKVYIGHVLDLINRDVDLIYIPRFISIEKGITFCPKFLGLPDMIENSLPGLRGKILTNQIRALSDDISDFEHYKVFVEKLNVKKRDLKKALKKAKKEWLGFRENIKDGYTIDQILNEDCCCSSKTTEDSDITIGLLGYVYNLYDNYINMDLLKILRKMNVQIMTFEMLSEENIESELVKFKKKMFWQFTNKLMGAGYYFIKSPQIDGIIHVTAFGCGPDSMLGPFLDIDASSQKKPFMTLRIDEQTGESHLITRLEAFVDMIKLSKQREEG